MSPDALQRAQQHLMAWIQLQQRTIIVNHISKVASDVAAPFQDSRLPGTPPLGARNGCSGAVQSGERFMLRFLYQTRVAELLAKKVTIIVQAQYDASTGLMTRHAFERQAA